jgi:hypothetical protein
MPLGKNMEIGKYCNLMDHKKYQDVIMTFIYLFGESMKQPRKRKRTTLNPLK